MPEDVNDLACRVDFWMLVLMGYIPSLGRTGARLLGRLILTVRQNGAEELARRAGHHLSRVRIAFRQAL